MKRIVSFLIAALLLVSSFTMMCGCESDEERALREAKEAAKAAEKAANKAQKDYNDLLDWFD